LIDQQVFTRATLC